MSQALFHPSFKAKPYWWEAHEPKALPEVDLPRDVPVAIVGGGYESDMPGFADLLSDAEIRAVLAYIKSTWPERERTYQENVSQPH